MMLLRSRASVVAMRSRTSSAIPASLAARIFAAASSSARCTARNTKSIVSPQSAAACSNGARRVSARSTQWDASAVPPAGRVAPNMPRAITRAPSHWRELSTGDQCRGVSPDGTSTCPDGSKTQHVPSRPRAAAVVVRTSSLVDVDTTAPAAARMAGTTMAVVLPERGGPSTSTPDPRAARAQPCAPAPR